MDNKELLQQLIQEASHYIKLHKSLNPSNYPEELRKVYDNIAYIKALSKDLT